MISGEYNKGLAGYIIANPDIPAAKCAPGGSTRFLTLDLFSSGFGTHSYT